MEYRFTGRKLEECLKKAELKLSMDRKNFNYNIISEEKGFLKKKCVIAVHLKEDNKVTNDTKKNENKIVVTEDKIMLKMQGEAELEFSKDIKLFVNNTEIKDTYINVKASDEIKYECENIEGKRSLNINTDKAKMQAHVTIEYTPEKIRKVIGCFKGKGQIKLTTELIDGKMPPLFTKEDLVKTLKDKGIVFGIIESEINKAVSERNVIDLLVAKGLEVVNDEDDRIKVNFEKTRRNVDADSKKNVDYKNLYSIANVNEGEVIAELIYGKEGHNGMNILGHEVKNKKKKTVNLAVKEGCKIENNKVIATIEGRPSVKNGVFSVNKVLETKNDVDIKSGNIDFVGDVVISGNVKDGMKVQAGNSIHIDKNVESAEVLSEGEIFIGGSVINSNICGGVDTIGVKEHIEFLKEFKKEIEMIILSVKEIRSRHVISEKKPDGEIIKLLLESKFRNVEKEAKEILKNNSFDNEVMDKVKQFLREKIIGSGTLGIKYCDQLYELIKCIDNEIQPEIDKISCPVDIYLNYCQDTKVKTTGNIYITGKGEYVSDLSAEGSIEFLSKDAVARGGKLQAGKDIKANIVGSVAGVTTTLKVPKDGVINVNIAYQNSKFIIGDKQYLLETASKEIKAYIDDKGEIVVDKFVL